MSKKQVTPHKDRVDLKRCARCQKCHRSARAWNKCYKALVKINLTIFG